GLMLNRQLILEKTMKLTSMCFTLVTSVTSVTEAVWRGWRAGVLHMVGPVRIPTIPALYRRVARTRAERRFGDTRPAGTSRDAPGKKPSPPGVHRRATGPRRTGYHHRE